MKKKIAIIIFCLLVVMCGAGCAWFFLSGGATTRAGVIEGYFKAIGSEDKALYKKSCYPAKWQKAYSNNNGKSLDNDIDEALNLQSGAAYSDVKIIVEEKLDKNRRDEVKDSIKRIYGIDLRIGAIYKESFSMNTSFGGSSASTGTLIRYTFKYNGKWYFMADTDVIIATGLE